MLVPALSGSPMVYVTPESAPYTELVREYGKLMLSTKAPLIYRPEVVRQRLSGNSKGHIRRFGLLPRLGYHANDMCDHRPFLSFVEVNVS